MQSKVAEQANETVLAGYFDRVSKRVSNKLRKPHRVKLSDSDIFDKEDCLKQSVELFADKIDSVSNAII